MKVCIVSGSLPNMPCGVGDYTASLAITMTEMYSDVDITLVTSRDERICRETYRAMELRYVSGWSIGNLREILLALQSSRPEIIHLQYPTAGYGRGIVPNIIPMVKALVRRGSKTVVTLHEFTEAHWLRKLAILPLLLFADAVVVCDPYEEGKLQRWFPALRKKLWRVPLASSIPVLTNKQSRGVKSDGLVLVYFGLLSRLKDVTVILAALATVRREGIDARLRVIGALSRRDQEIFLVAARQLGVADHVCFEGFRSAKEVSHILAEGDIALLPYRDGVTLRRTTLLTVMGHGLPTVTTRKEHYVPDGLAHGDNIMLARASALDEFTACVRQLALDPALREHVGRRGQAWATRFRWDGIADAHVDLYRTLVHASKEPVP